MIQTHHNLFGPVQYDGALKAVGGNGQVWQFPGSALTPSTKRFNFNLGFNAARRATWEVVWTGNNIFNRIRLVNFDDGPSNISEMGVFSSDGSPSPRPLLLDFTEAFNRLVGNGVMKHLGFQVSHITSFVLYEVRLEIVW